MLPAGFLSAPSGAIVPALTNLGGCTTTSGTSGSTNCTSSGAGNAGDLVIAGSVISNTSGTGTVAFSSAQCSNGQYLDTPNSSGTGQGMEAAAWGCVLTGTQTPNVVAAWTGVTGTSPSLNVQVIHSNVGWGVGSTNVLLDRYNSSVNASSGNCATGTTNATRNPNTVNFAFCFTTSSESAFNAPSTYTQQGTNSIHGAIFSLINSTAGTQTATTTLGTNHASTGIMASVHLGTAYDCSIGSCAWVQGTDSGNQTANYDHITLSAFKNGDSGIYCQSHNAYTGTGTVTMTDPTGYTNWYAFNTNTGGAVSLTINDNTAISGTYGMYCFYTPSFAGLNGGVSATLVGQPTATDCAVSCTWVGGIFFEWSGLFNWDTYNNSSSGATSGSGANNASCTSMTTSANNDFIINAVLVGQGTAGPTITAGTNPITFTIPTISSNVAGQEEYALWSSSGAINPHITLGTASVAYGDICLAFY